MRAVLVGAGRMGLTHLALFNLLTSFGVRWVVVEPSLPVRLGLRRSLPRQLVESCVADIPDDLGRCDFAVITSPTGAHASAHGRLAGRVRKIFVEKPLAVLDPGPGTLCGYVLLHHPLHVRLRTAVAGLAAGRLRVSLRANTVLGENRGWRGREDQGGGVINEFGSHALSLLVDLAGPVQSIAVTARETVHSVDAPDRATLTGRSARGLDFEVSLDWTDAAVRKPSYQVRVDLPEGTAIEHDFNEFRDAGGTSSIADAESHLGAYLRGIEFTRQAQHFLERDTFPEILAVAVEVDRLLGAIRDRPR